MAKVTVKFCVRQVDGRGLNHHRSGYDTYEEAESEIKRLVECVNDPRLITSIPGYYIRKEYRAIKDGEQS